MNFVFELELYFLRSVPVKNKMLVRHGGEPKAVKKAKAFFTGAKRSPRTAVGSKMLLQNANYAPATRSLRSSTLYFNFKDVIFFSKDYLLGW